MEIKGQKMLKVIGILMIIFAALAMVVSILTLVTGGLLVTATGFAEDADVATAGGIVAAAFYIVGVVSILCAAFELITGILGVSAASTPSVGKLKAALVLDIIIIVVSLATILYNTFTGGFAGQAWYMTLLTTVGSLVLPILFLLGLSQYKNGLVALMGGDE